MKIWRRNAVVSTIVLFVCVALYLSWSYSRTPDSKDDSAVFDPGQKTVESANTQASEEQTAEIAETESEPVSTYFDEARLTRKKARDSALAILSDATGRTEASQDVRDNAAKEIETLAKNAMTEANIENLVKAKGFTECVAFINQDGISVVVSEPVGGLTPSDAAKIKDIVLEETSLTTMDIKISSVAV